MFDALYRLLTGADHPGQIAEHDETAFALAVLLIEVARSDDRIEAGEKNVIGRALARRYGLTDDEVARLVAAAERGALQAVDLFRFTKIVVENFSDAERVSVIEMLWEVAYSDGILTGDEDAHIRRVAGLIYVSDRERGEARLGVLRRLQESDPGAS